jgi:mannose-6-phosphate isomerase
VLDFRPAKPAVLRPVPGGATYQTPVDDFRLSRQDLGDQPSALPGGGPQIVLCIAGTARLRDRPGHELELRRGQSAFLSAADAGVNVAGHGTVLLAAVGSANALPTSTLT